MDDQIKRERLSADEAKLSYQQQTVLNLYNCGIIPEIIAIQLDLTEREVINIIRKVLSDDKRKEESIKQVSDSSSLGMFYLDSVIDTERSIKDAQKRMWTALKLEPKFGIPLEQTQEILEKFCDSKITLAILHVDLVGSTKLSMTLPTEKLAIIVQAFTQEMSLLITAYGGHVFKYVGDAILAFFFLSDNNLYLPCSNAVNCARTMIRVMQDGINPILNDNDYPEMGLRVGIDAGENVVVQYGWSTNSYTLIEKNHDNETDSHNDKDAQYYIDNKDVVSSITKDNSGSNNTSRVIRKPHLDVLGYTTSIAAKMTGFATPNQIMIGQSVYESLDSANKSKFKKVNISKNDWDYINPSTGKVYDGIVRNNAGLAIGDIAHVRKIKVKPAEKVFVAPLEAIPPIDERYLSDSLESVSMTKGDNFIVPYFGGRLIFQVVGLTPATSEAVIINQGTQFIITERDQAIRGVDAKTVAYEDIGGLKDEIQRVREMIELPLRHPEIFEKLGIEAPKGVLLHGPPGTGKTLLAKAVANESNSHFLSISGPEIMSKFYGESEARLREIFKEAREKAPSIIFIDEIDSIAPKREEVMGEVERRVVSQLLSVMDGLESRGKVVVIAASNRPNAIDPALRRPGRFDREIEIKVPDKRGRLEVLQVHARNMPLNIDVDQDKIAAVTHGFVGADLEYLCKEAAMKCLRRLLPELKLGEEKVPPETLEKLVINMNDFQNAIREITPSAMREVYLEPPEVKWDDIGGLDAVKRELQEAVEGPIRFPEVYKQLGHTAPKGILLHGPSGTGKTMLAKAVATESEANFISIKGPELVSKWVGESERGIREIFRKARQASSCVIFFDEIDSIASVRGGALMGGFGIGAGAYSGSERMISQLLTEMDGIQEMHDVVVIAATNRVDMIDTALLRPGRFDKIVYIPNPDKITRERILQIYTKDKPIKKDIDMSKIAELTEGYSGADVSSVANTAVSLVLHDHIQKYPSPDEASKHTSEALVSMRHFEDAIKKVRGQREMKPEEKINLSHYG